MKPIDGTKSLPPTLSPSARPPSQPPQPPQPNTATLGDASRQRTMGVDEKQLRAALIAVREALARVLTEPDPLVQHLGLRHVAREAAAQTWDVVSLPRQDEQDFARQLLAELPSRESVSAQGLDPQARADLETLLHYEALVLDHAAAAARRDAAVHASAPPIKEHERLVAELARLTSQTSVLPHARVPPWQRTLVPMVFGVAALLLVATLMATSREGGTAPSAPAAQWTLTGAGVLAAAAAVWWRFHPGLRRTRLFVRLERMRARLVDVAPRAAAAREGLRRALELFARIDAELRAEEAAVDAVLRRHPGVRQYLSTARMPDR